MYKYKLTLGREKGKERMGSITYGKKLIFLNMSQKVATPKFSWNKVSSDYSPRYFRSH